MVNGDSIFPATGGHYSLLTLHSGAPQRQNLAKWLLGAYLIIALNTVCQRKNINLFESPKVSSSICFHSSNLIFAHFAPALTASSSGFLYLPSLAHRYVILCPLPSCPCRNDDNQFKSLLFPAESTLKRLPPPDALRRASATCQYTLSDPTNPITSLSSCSTYRTHH